MNLEVCPFKVPERIVDNAYKLELLGDMNVIVTFNLGNLAPYVEDDFEDLMANPCQKRKVDAYCSTCQLLVPPLSSSKCSHNFLHQE